MKWVESFCFLFIFFLTWLPCSGSLRPKDWAGWEVDCSRYIPRHIINELMKSPSSEDSLVTSPLVASPLYSWPTPLFVPRESASFPSLIFCVLLPLLCVHVCKYMCVCSRVNILVCVCRNTYIHVCMFLEARGQPQVSFLRSSLLCFRDRVSCWDLQLTD